MIGRHALTEFNRGEKLRLSFDFSTHADPIPTPLCLFNLFKDFFSTLLTNPSSATRRTGRVDWNRSVMAGFAAAHG
jgi:hypothetical protein